MVKAKKNIFLPPDKAPLEGFQHRENNPVLEGSRFHSSSKCRILVIDDDPIIISLLKSRLEEENFQVTTAMNGDKGLELAKESCPDLIILDVMLPGIGGYDVCIQLKNDPKTSQIPVLILSCRCGDLDQQIGFNCGADDYLGKPYKSDELLGKIRKLLKINKGGVRLSEKVVVAVKDKNNFKLIKKILLKAGINDIAFMQYECDIIEAFQITKPDFIIMDLNLKDTDALNLSRKLNSIKGFSAKCIVIFDDKKEEEKFVYTEMCLLDRIIQRSKLQDKLITCLQDLS